MALRDEWQGFSAGHWTDDVNVRDFIQRNYTQYEYQYQANQDI